MLKFRQIDSELQCRADLKGIKMEVNGLMINTRVFPLPLRSIVSEAER